MRDTLDPMEGKPNQFVCGQAVIFGQYHVSLTLMGEQGELRQHGDKVQGLGGPIYIGGVSMTHTQAVMLADEILAAAEKSGFLEKYRGTKP